MIPNYDKISQRSQMVAASLRYWRINFEGLEDAQYISRSCSFLSITLNSKLAIVFGCFIEKRLII